MPQIIRLIVANRCGEQPHTARHTATGQGGLCARRSRECGGHARYDFIVQPDRHDRVDFLIQSAKNCRIAAFEPHHAFVLHTVLNQRGIDVRLFFRFGA